MGKALDIHIIKKKRNLNTKDEKIVCYDLVRDILTEKTNAENKYRWFYSNGIALENSYTRY